MFVRLPMVENYLIQNFDVRRCPHSEGSFSYQMGLVRWNPKLLLLKLSRHVGVSFVGVQSLDLIGQAQAFSTGPEAFRAQINCVSFRVASATDEPGSGAAIKTFCSSMFHFLSASGREVSIPEND
jgi:hypothetical protein